MFCRVENTGKKALFTGEIAVFIQIILVFNIFWISSIVPSMYSLRFLMDAVLLFGIISGVGIYQSRLHFRKGKIQLWTIAAIVLATILCFALSDYSVLMYLWGARNNFRFFLFFIVCIVVLRERSVDIILKFVKVMFWIDVPLSAVMYLLGYKNDLCGGVFGTLAGCNAYQNALICFMWAYALGRFMTGKMRLPGLCLYAAGTLLIALTAEIKFFYILFVLLLGVTVLINKPSVKTVLIIFAGIMIIAVGVSALYKIAPESAAQLFEEETRNSYLSDSGYTNSGDLNRTNAVPQIHKMFFSENKKLSVLGYGLGYCDTGAGVSSEFYKKYEYLHYRWFSHAWVYLEQGALGLILLILFFINNLVYVLRRRKNFRRKDLWIMSLLFNISVLVCIMYNNALEIELCYFLSLGIAVPYVLEDKKKKEQVNENRNNLNAKSA